MVVSVGTDDLGEHARIAGVALGARGGVPLPIAGGLYRVDRVDHIAGRHQRLDPPTTVGFGPDDHRARLVGVLEMVGNQGMQLPKTCHTLRQPTPYQDPSLLVL